MSSLPYPKTRMPSGDVRVSCFGGFDGCLNDSERPVWVVVELLADLLLTTEASPRCYVISGWRFVSALSLQTGRFFWHPLNSDHAYTENRTDPGELTLGLDNGSAFIARRFRGRLAELRITHRRGGYRDPESQAFVESWFGKLKEREVWLHEYETLDDAQRGIGGYVDRYHHRPTRGSAIEHPTRSAGPGRTDNADRNPRPDVSTRGGEQVFALVSRRYERGSIIVTSNRGFEQWGEILGDTMVAAALIDRLVHHATMITLKGKELPPPRMRLDVTPAAQAPSLRDSA